jgi:hypothetical protein
MPIAATANAARRIGAPPCPMVRCGQERAGERMGFIFSCLNWFVQKIVYSEKVVQRHPMKIATIRLQWNPKAKMMRAVRIFTEQFYCGRSASFLRRQKDSFK